MHLHKLFVPEMPEQLLSAIKLAEGATADPGQPGIMGIPPTEDGPTESEQAIISDAKLTGGAAGSEAADPGQPGTAAEASAKSQVVNAARSSSRAMHFFATTGKVPGCVLQGVVILGTPHSGQN